MSSSVFDTPSSPTFASPQPQHDCSCPNSASSLPIIHDITSLALLPTELQTLVHDYLIADTCPAHTIALARLSKHHYATLIPRLYKRIVVTDEAIDRGLYEGLQAEFDQVETGAGEERLLSKWDLLGTCESLVFASLYAMDATDDACRERYERYQSRAVWNGLRGLFDGVTHRGYEADAIVDYCQQVDDDRLHMDEGVSRSAKARYPALYTDNLSHACFHLPYPLHSALSDAISDFYEIFPAFTSPARMRFVTRFHNCQSDRPMTGVEWTVRNGHTMIVDMLPTEIEQGGEAEVEVLVCNIVDCCLRVLFRDSDNGSVPQGMIFTNFGTTLSPDGTIRYLSPHVKQTVLEKAQSVVRQKVREELEEVSAVNVAVADKIYVRGYEACEFCSDL
ncbi:hypothetical protein B9479_003115 [Cryptococcus floricola]|uniref:Uncharacterized protein n=1 Tax=Cryptococcus floricola TaxID=2591691 RepID=A0A5D3B124_9TREE|nr:hypothetical protein B9479_003115 [Cryptococcus floricola]